MRADGAPADGLDAPERFAALAARIREKPALRALYEEHYRKYREVLARTEVDGHVLELGSGGGFAKDRVPGIITSDVIAYAGVDRVIDACCMPFADGALRAVFLTNVLHHIGDADSLFRELARCLAPGGRALIIDQWPGIPGRFVLRHLHHEPFDDGAARWSFPSTGPLSDANGALPWIVFERDAARFAREHPLLEVVRREPHTALRYWLSGGLKRWSLVPGPMVPVATALDEALRRLSPRYASFVDVELLRRTRSPGAP